MVDEIPGLAVLDTEGIPPVEEEPALRQIPEPEEEAPAAASSPREEPGHERAKSPASDADADAEGEVDPDYVPSEGDEDSAAAVVEAVIPVVSDEADDDPFVIKEDLEMLREEVMADEGGKASLPSPVETYVECDTRRFALINYFSARLLTAKSLSRRSLNSPLSRRPRYPKQ